ncbi:MAG TPA: hypothetical protein EYQ86_09960 [Bacteroidetes bacterium]|nr:hypothetical protein [Bacteroidota bacterium]
MDALIVGCKQEFKDIVGDFPECSFFASNYSTYVSLKGLGVKYLYDSTIDITNAPNDLEFLSMNWYRNDKGFDIFSKDLISFAPAITRRVFSSFANDYRNYYAIKKLFDDYDLVYLSKYAELSFIRTAKVFENRVKWYESEKRYEYPDTSSPERTVINNPSNKFIIASKIAYIFQSLFIRLIRKNTLVLDDWTYREEFSKRDDCLISNYYLPWKAFYFSYSRDVMPESKLIFPKVILSDAFNSGFIKDKLSKEHFSWDQDLVELFVSTVFRVYTESYVVLRQTYSVYSKLLSHYRPNTVVFPGESYFSYIIAAQIAKKCKIKTVLAIDGYQVLKERALFFYDYNNKNLLFDKYVAFGESQRKLYDKHQNIPSNQVVVAQSPIINKLTADNDINYKYDAIVMSYLPNQHNPNARWDQRYKITIDAVKVIHSLGLNSVAVKIKDGVNRDKEIQMYKNHFTDSDQSYCPDIIIGEFNQYLSKTKFIVGQISSALFEASCKKVPYIVYEPYDNGVTDYSLKESILINRDSIARDTHELGEMIRRKETSVMVEYKDLTSGLPLRELQL